MRPTDQIKQTLKDIKVKTNPTVNQAVLDDLLGRLETAQQNNVSVKPNAWRTFMKTRMTKLTAAAAVLIVGFVIWTQVAFVQPTFADIVRPLMTAQTLIYDFITGLEESGTTMHDIVKGSRIRRTISTMPGMTMILDTENSRMLVLQHEKKTGSYFDMKGPLGLGTEEFLKFVRETIRQVQTQTEPQYAPVKLGVKELDGRKVVGYAAGSEHVKIEIWADVKTSLPVKITLGIGPQTTTLKNFEFDVPVDDALVSMDLPAGYTLEEAQMDLSDATEQDFIAGLKVWTELFTDGYFPESITVDDYMKKVPLLEGAVTKLNLSPEESKQLGVSFMKGMMFLTLFEAKGHKDWHYAGNGVKVGDASKAIFWYKPKDAQDYRVIYGDLRVEDVPADQLPQ
ncbi:MAG: hypothetical protein LLF76_05955 [Planctomycetaceae bacterium]|nr:hypothetical protein [Planctomycetaceae bacterium]